MPSSDKPKPVADAYAIVGQGDDALWINIGPVWLNRDGSQTITMLVEPIAWQNPKCERRIQIRKREQRQSGQGRARRDDDE